VFSGYTMDTTELVFFLLAAIALPGSPGPAIAALLAVGSSHGWVHGLKFYGGLQSGLAIAAAVSVAGLFTAISVVPAAALLMTVVATLYLFYLAFTIALSPVGQETRNRLTSSSPLAGLFPGITNPKAYLAFASLFGSFEIVSASAIIDSMMKWFGVVMVMIVVDIVWLWAGVRLGQINMSVKSERVMNYTLAALIVIAALMALF